MDSELYAWSYGFAKSDWQYKDAQAAFDAGSKWAGLDSDGNAKDVKVWRRVIEQIFI